MIGKRTLLGYWLPLCFLFPAWVSAQGFIFGGGATADAPKVELALTVKGVQWADDRSALVAAELTVTSDDPVVQSGELRVTMMGINARIDFDNVAVTALSGDLPEGIDREQRPFFLLPVLTVERGETRRFELRVALPPGSDPKGGALQLFAFLTGQPPEGATWYVRAVAAITPPPAPADGVPSVSDP